MSCTTPVCQTLQGDLLVHHRWPPSFSHTCPQSCHEKGCGTCILYFVTYAFMQDFHTRHTLVDPGGGKAGNKGWTCVICFVIMQSNMTGRCGANPFGPLAGNNLPCNCIQADLLLRCYCLYGFFKFLEAEFPGSLLKAEKGPEMPMPRFLLPQVLSICNKGDTVSVHLQQGIYHAFICTELRQAQPGLPLKFKSKALRIYFSLVRAG